MARLSKRKRGKLIRNLALLLIIVSGYIVTFGILSSNTDIDHSIDKNLYYEQQERIRLQRIVEHKSNIVCSKNVINTLTICRYNISHGNLNSFDQDPFQMDKTDRQIWENLIKLFKLKHALVLGESFGISSLYLASLGASVLVTPMNRSAEQLVQSAVMRNSLEHLVMIYADTDPTIQEVMRLSRDQIDMAIINMNHYKCGALSSSIFDQPFPTEFHPNAIKVEMNMTEPYLIPCLSGLTAYLLKKGYKTQANNKYKGFWFDKAIATDIRNITLDYWI